MNTTPNLDTDTNSGEGGIWQTGNGLVSDGTRLFVETANGDFNPTVGDYGDSFLTITPDSSTASNPNLTGYGLAVTDYFTPYNEQALADADADLGSGGSPFCSPFSRALIPTSLVGSGKQGVVYVVDADNMGHHGTTSDTGRVVQEVSLGHGNFDSPAYFNGMVYYNAVGDSLKAFTVTNGLLSAAPTAIGHDSNGTPITYANQGATPSVSANGAANGIVWNVQWDASHEVLHAYDATTLLELYNSNQNVSRDQLGVGVKFITPTIADGHVFVGSANALTVFGLVTPPTTPPAAPSNLAATATSASSIKLTWVDNSNNESGFKIERSTDNVSFTQIAVASANATTYTDSTVNPNTTYYYRIRATNIIGDSAYTAPAASATTPVTTGAIDIYHFDAGSGMAAIDSGSGNNGTLTGTTLPQWVPGKIGTGALSFSGDGTYNQAAAQSAVTVSSNLAPILGSTSTLDVWVKTTQIGNATHWQRPAITGVEQTSGANDINWGTLDATGHIGIYVGDAGGVYSTSPVNDGQWHNIAMTRNATTGVVQLYVDGVLNGSGTFDTGNKTSQFFLIGALADVASDGVTRTGDNYFNGQLDEVRIYNQVLGANEIAGLALVPAAPTLQSATASSGPVVHLVFSNTSSYAQNLEIDRKPGAAGTYAAIATVSAGATMYDDINVVAGTQYFYVVKAIDLAGTSPASNEVSVTPPGPTIVANSIFYNGSSYDGQNGSSNQTDTNAVAPDKQALLPGQTASFQNYTSYSKGINGIIIDVANLEFLPRVDDFTFLVGNNNDPLTWTPAPMPTYVNAYPGRGPDGSTQITLIWDDNVIENEWLQVTMLAQPHLELTANDVFYYGNSIGDTGNSPTDADVTAGDVLATRSNISASPESMTNLYDFNRDKVVDSQDLAIAQQNVRVGGAALQLITVPMLGGGAATNIVATASHTIRPLIPVDRSSTISIAKPPADLVDLALETSDARPSEISAMGFHPPVNWPEEWRQSTVASRIALDDSRRITDALPLTRHRPSDQIGPDAEYWANLGSVSCKIASTFDGN